KYCTRSRLRCAVTSQSLPISPEAPRSTRDAKQPSRLPTPILRLGKRGNPMFYAMTRVLALAAFTVFLPISNALAHCFVGGRFMPATLIVDDPCVADELSLPTVSRFKN